MLVVTMLTSLLVSLAHADSKLSVVRAARPLALSANILGKTPIGGATVDINLWPYTSIGTGLGYFKVQNVSGTILPVYLRAFALPWNVSPYIDVGLGFLSVTFATQNSLLDSTFTGIQTLMGIGGEWRSDTGFLARIEITRYFNAKVWIPGASIGFAFDLPNDAENPKASKNRALLLNP